LKELKEYNGFRLYVPVEMMYSGWALAEEGETDEGLKRMERGLAEYRSTGSLIKFVEVQVMHAEVLRKAGFTERALDALEDGIAQASKSQEHLLEPELYRIRGEIRLGQGDESAAVADFDRALDIARGQGALSLELRAVMSKCQLLRRQGKLDEARRRLSKVYDCFTEGFNTKDLVEAKSLIGELCAP
jgi:predicted ATPase